MRIESARKMKEEEEEEEEEEEKRIERLVSKETKKQASKQEWLLSYPYTYFLQRLQPTG